MTISILLTKEQEQDIKNYLNDNTVYFPFEHYGDPMVKEYAPIMNIQRAII